MAWHGRLSVHGRRNAEHTEQDYFRWLHRHSSNGSSAVGDPQPPTGPMLSTLSVPHPTRYCWPPQLMSMIWRLPPRESVSTRIRFLFLGVTRSRLALSR